MKKYTFIFLLLAIVGTTSGQTILNRFPLELKKSSEYFQILNAENSQKEYFTFVTDKEKCTLIKSNSALFFKDSLTIPRPHRDYDFMAGVTFSVTGHPQVYWVSKDYRQIKLVDFDLENRTSSFLDYENNNSREKIVDAFTVDNVFYILSLTSENTLKFTHFSNSGKNQHEIDLGNKSTENDNKVDRHLVSSIFDYGLTKIESKLYTPLYMATAKVKRYLTDNIYTLTFDAKKATTICNINLTDFSFEKHAFPYAISNKNSGSNSFMVKDVLYQITANSAAITIEGFDVKTKNSIGKYHAVSKEEISFKNSPLLLQAENGRVRTLKSTSKMLNRMDFSSLGISIYATPNYNLFTLGGVRQVASGGGLALAIGLGIGGALSGSDVMAGSDFISDSMQSIYFESFFDTDFKHTTAPFRPIYIDAMGEFLDDTRPTVYNISTYKNFVILNYYDSKAKELVMRKFEDVVD